MKEMRQRELLKKLYEAAVIERKTFIPWDNARKNLKIIYYAAREFECHPSDIDEALQKAKTQFEPVTIASNIAILNLKRRTYNALWNNSIETIGQLSSYTAKEISRFHGIGTPMVAIISDALAKCGFKLRESNADQAT